MLCSLCRPFAESVVRQEFSAPWIFDYGRQLGNGRIAYEHGSHATIVASAEAGCQFCRFFLLMLRLASKTTSSTLQKQDQTIRIRPSLGKTAPWVEQLHDVYTFDFGGDWFTGNTTFRVCRSREPASARVIGSSMPEGDLASFRAPASIHRVSSWLQQCEGSHAQCRRAKNSPLPSRVVEVDENGSVKLLETQGLASRYITLSYCWGTAHPYLTTKGTLEANKLSILAENLPRTLRDAIEFTRLLGFRYIWIDALCIIQDDVGDWRREAAKMCAIYENATLSLSIASSGSCDEGFLDGKPQVEQVSIGTDTMAVGLRRQPGRTKAKMFQLDGCALEQRAWTLQERLLAPAVLHFVADTMIWECCAGCAFEDQAEIVPILTKSLEPRGIVSWDILFRIKPLLRAAAPEQASALWYHLAQKYSNRRLTRESDRHAALHGLATSFQRCKGAAHISGHWVDELHYELMWEPWLPAGERLKEFRNFRPPTWEWMVGGPRVRFPKLKEGTDLQDPVKSFRPEARIEIIATGDESSLRARPPSLLRIHGAWRKGELYDTEVDGRLTRHFVPDEDDELPWRRIECHSDISMNNLTSSERREDGVLCQRPVYCLLISSYFKSKDDRYPCEAHFLLLQEVNLQHELWKFWISSGGGSLEGDVPYFFRMGTAHCQLDEEKEVLRTSWRKRKPDDGKRGCGFDALARDDFRDMVLV